MIEEWRLIPDFPTYEASNVGRIKGPQGIKQLGINSHGYLVVHLSHKNRQFSRTVHSLVALAFIGPRPGKKVINHRNGVKTDASVSNLEYVTARENSRHAVRTGLTVALRGSAKSTAYLTEAQIPELFADAANGMQRRALSVKYGIARSTIDSILLRRIWRHVTIPPPTLKRVLQLRKRKNVGMDNPLAKLSPDKVLRIFELAKSGMRLDDIALTIGNSRAGVSLVLHRRTWAHIPLPKNLIPTIKPSGRLFWK